MRTIRVSFRTLGCKSNQYDTEQMAEVCRQAGFDVVPSNAAADVCVINTCTVTALADAQGRQMLRRMRRACPQAHLIAVGCGVTVDGCAYRRAGADVVFGVRCAGELVTYLRKRIELCGDDGMTMPLVPMRQLRARALLKIQDGCNSRCTYCAVWRARGTSISIKPQEVLGAYRALSAYPEVMLTGIHIGQYGRDLDPPTSLWDVVSSLADESDGPRIRLGSLDPDDIGDAAAAVFGARRVCRHVHISIQSGSARVLGMMGRSYRPVDIQRAADMLAHSVPGIGIGADLIAGFPGETDDDHRETLAMIEHMPVSFVHVFPFSSRPDTEAASMPAQIPVAVRRRRARELIELGKRRRISFAASQRGAVVEAVVVSRAPDRRGMMRAVTDNYLSIACPARPESYGRFLKVRIDSVNRDGEVMASCI